MRYVRLLFLFALATTGCADRKPEAPRAFDPGPVPAELAVGETAFDRTCAACHGLKARGTEQGPPLVHIIYEPNHHSDEAFRRAVALGVVPHHWSFGAMPAQAGVSPEDVEAIIRYIRWLQTRAGISQASPRIFPGPAGESTGHGNPPGQRG